ncbi:hypothetical protein [Paraburkholderia elongata]|uniref:Uncharacterized protein n=1 Tax=Paraburkholderia elongata TaxID=2675747 RepID=A0A972NL34_9BURK|nr:hypothetical protein [Paraburkholderia elongata]NPT55428.1 hypothetical protein [Paraburkholderia elongata]
MREINSNAAEIRVQLNASQKAGSFGIDLVASQYLLSQIKDIFSGSGATAIANGWTIMQIVGFTAAVWSGLLRVLKARRPVKIEQKGDVTAGWMTQT